LSELAELLKKVPKAKKRTLREQKALEDKKERKKEKRPPPVKQEKVEEPVVIEPSKNKPVIGKLTTDDFELVSPRAQNTKGFKSKEFSKDDVAVEDYGNPDEPGLYTKDGDQIALITLEEKGPQFSIDNVTGTNEILRLDSGKSLTDYVLKEGIKIYKKRISLGPEPEVLAGTIIRKNSDNFQKEFIVRFLNDRDITREDNMQQSIKNISFGKSRSKLGYSEFEFSTKIRREPVAIKMKDGSVQVIDDVPAKFGIYARKPKRE
jgi:hypothetical protein